MDVWCVFVIDRAVIFVCQIVDPLSLPRVYDLHQEWMGISEKLTHKEPTRYCLSLSITKKKMVRFDRDSKEKVSVRKPGEDVCVCGSKREARANLPEVVGVSQVLCPSGIGLPPRTWNIREWKGFEVRRRVASRRASDISTYSSRYSARGPPRLDSFVWSGGVANRKLGAADQGQRKVRDVVQMIGDFHLVTSLVGCRRGAHPSGILGGSKRVFFNR